MKVVRNERITLVDVDETLVMHSDPSVIGGKFINSIEISDPYSSSFIKVWLNEPMIRILREERRRGAHTIVWSKGGYAWAEAVIKALCLEEYVDTIMSKPFVYLDDKDVSEWLKDRVYIKPTVTYKDGR